MAASAGVEFQFLQGRHRKERLVEELLRKKRHTEGLICVLCCMETDWSIRLRYGKALPRLEFSKRQQRALYFYFLDDELGLIHIRVSTWFPFSIQVYVNGHSWLAQQMLKKGLGYKLRDNAFTALDDPAKAQRLADQFVHQDWKKTLNRLAKKVNPLLRQRWLLGYQYYWVLDQAEYATDLIFTSQMALAELYPRLLEHAAVNFLARDILTFLGRRWHASFDGEILTEYKTDRWPGARVKHRMKNNWLKMYDKFGLILRIETVINNPKEFRVRRLRTRQGRQEMAWCPMRKGIRDFYRYQEVALASNQRYLEALSVVDNPAFAYYQVEMLTQPQRVANRSYAGFNPASSHDIRLFQAVLDGNNLLRGFRNSHIRDALHRSTKSVEERRRQSAATGRLLKRLHVRALLVKIPRSRRWHVSNKGQSLLQAVIQLYHHGIPGAIKRAA